MGSSRLVEEIFTSDGSWICPPGVTQVILIGFGGGGGGGGGCGYRSGYYLTGGGGGGGARQMTRRLNVIPGESYTVTIGAGGAGGALGTSGGGYIGGNGGNGTRTAFAATMAPFIFAAFVGGGGGGGGTYNSSGSLYAYALGGTSAAISTNSQVAYQTISDVSTQYPYNREPGNGGFGGQENVGSIYGYDSVEGYTGGAQGTVLTGSIGNGGAGGGGGAGPEGNGAAGGNGGNASTDPAAGGSPSNNSGAGGGGAGGQGSHALFLGSDGIGGPGGSGKLYINYIA